MAAPPMAVPNFSPVLMSPNRPCVSSFTYPAQQGARSSSLCRGENAGLFATSPLLLSRIGLPAYHCCAGLTVLIQCSQTNPLAIGG